ncbi:MAG: hypothetical protein GEU71_12745 [Actinobacteria bacterium]|nr:hypothetical protein [Actinomycetota bacterium]
MEAWVGLAGVFLGSGIGWFLARDERKHRVREARRAEKKAAFERFAIYLQRLESISNTGFAAGQLKEDLEEVWMPVLLVCEWEGPVHQEIMALKNVTPQAGVPKGTAVDMIRAMQKEMGR